MKTLRAKKIRMLFGKDGVGIEKIKQVTYSIYAISSLTNSQIQNVIKNVTSVKPLLETATNHNHVISKTVTKRDDQTNAKVSISTKSISANSARAGMLHVSQSNVLPKLFPFKKKLSKEVRNQVINKLTTYFTDSPKLDKNSSIDTEGEHQTDSYWVLGSHCPLCRENHMSLDGKWWLDSRSKNTYYLHCTNLKELGIPLDDVLKAYSGNSGVKNSMLHITYPLE
ncbi:hypothetical protein Glove_413g22 [Diversispora epigaea]|uniref:Uncharacterized protein n=1 Tax=Diversispora epigaea TaxID=1348612 RepID=A0A397H1S0_9GLOM|nr:hypothetical protein Glove_413g22 [Diversispora epigaea]